MKLLLTSLLLLAPLAAAQDGCDFNQEEIDAIVQEAWPAVVAATGLAEEGELPVARIARSHEVRKVLRQDLLPQMAVQFPKEELAKAAAGQKASELTRNLYAKTAFSTGEVLVLPKTFERLSNLLDLPDVCSRAALRGVLVHELVHVADNRRFGLAKVAAKAGSIEALRMVDAVIEGHAQFVARKVCSELGWQKGFDAFTRSIDAYPAAGQGAAVDLVLRVRAADSALSYIQGERFVAEVAAKEGREGLVNLFNSPPTDLALIYRPDWYLNPAARQHTPARLSAGLDELGRDLERTDWIPYRFSVSLGQLAASLSILSGENDAEGRRLLTALLTNRGFVLSNPDGRMVSAILYEFATEQDAQAFVDINGVLMHQKDKDMREGAVRVLKSFYEPLDEPGLKGLLVKKEMEVNGAQQEINVSVVARDNLMLELTYLVEPIEPLDLVEIGARILDQAFTAAPETSLDLDFDDLEPGTQLQGFIGAQTNAKESPASWTIVEIPSAPSGKQALHVTTEAKGNTYNVFLAKEPSPADLEVSVQLCADTGEEDRGGGLVWHAEGPDDYYVARWNPLEQNLRVYTVKDGNRSLLKSADTNVNPGAWHALRVTQRGSHIQVSLSGLTYLELDDTTFPEGGTVGLWSKADASTWFDDFVVR